MQLLRVRDLRVGFSERELFTIDQLDIFAGERIGLVGDNGSGKSTLLDVLVGLREPLGGQFERHGDWTPFRQFETALTPDALDEAQAGLWALHGLYGRTSETFSGGEQTRARLADVLARPGDFLLLDEPTANLDAAGIAQLMEALWAVPSCLIISHDRALLDALTTRTLEIREGQLVDYPGHYSAYAAWREQEFERRMSAYEQYEAEKQRLTALAQDQKRRAAKTQRRPRGISTSDARARAFSASKRSYEGIGKRMNAAARATERRLERLEVQARPETAFVIRPDFSLTDPPRNPVIAESFALSFGWPGQAKLFDHASFQLRRGVHAALVGPNGCGKSTLLQLIVEGHPDIRSVPKARYGLFRQDLELIDDERTILENMRRDSVQAEQVNRSVLARMGFTAERVDKPAKILSGGERVRLSFAMLAVSDANVLLIDEPTNYLDLASMEAIEGLLQDYEGTVLLVTHDRHLIEAVAEEIWTIEEGKIVIEPVAGELMEG